MDPVITFKDELLIGEQRAEALRLLGINYEMIDECWHKFVEEINYRRLPPLSAAAYSWALTHQEGMWWRLDVNIVGEPVTDIEGLAYVDPKSIHREITYHAKSWAPMDTGPYGVSPTTFSEEEKSECLECSGALAATWIGVDADDVKATEDAHKALQDAATHLQDALDEIHIAWRVAKSHWQGPRSEAVRAKFEVESEIISSLRQMTENWQSYMAAVAAGQREGKNADDRLFRELMVEVAVEIAALSPVGRLFKVVFSSAKYAKAAWAGKKVVSFVNTAGRMGLRLHTDLSRLATRITGIGNKPLGAFALRGAAESAKDLAATSINHALSGKSYEGDDWFKIFVVSGLAGPAAGEGMQALAEKYGWDKFVDRYGAATAGESGAKAAAKSFTDEALGLPLAVGVSTAPAKAALKAKIMKELERRMRAGKLSQADVDRYEGRIDKGLGLAWTISEKKAEKEAARQGEESEIPSAPPGTVPQRVGS